MKRYLVLLFLAFTTAGLSFGAQVERSAFSPTLAASGSLGWNWDLATGATGFANSYDISVRIPILGRQTFSTLETGDIYGSLEISGMDYSLIGLRSGAQTPQQTVDISAKLVFAPFYLVVYDGNLLNTGKAQANPGSVDTRITRFVAPATSTTPLYKWGTGFGMNAKTAPDIPIEFLFKVLSAGTSWEDNTAGNYAFGLDVTNFTIVPELLGLQTSLFYNPYATRPMFNGGLKVPLTFDIAYGLTVTPAFDIQIDAGAAIRSERVLYDGGLEVNFALSGKNVRNNEAAAIIVNSFMGTDKDISARLQFFEPDQAGLIEYIGLDVSGTVLNVIQISTSVLLWNINVTPSLYLDFDEYNSLTLTVPYVINNDLTTTLSPSINFRNAMGIPSTTIDIGYSPGDILASTWKGGSFATSLRVSF